MKLISQDQILIPATRKLIIDQLLTDPGVKARKDEHKKRAEVYKDKTNEWALQLINKEMGANVVEEMRHRVPNINITRKVVKKKARVYKDRPKRTVEKPEGATGESKTQDLLDAYVDALRLDSFMKEVNRAVELHYNILVQIQTRPDTEDLTAGEKKPRWSVGLKLLRPDRFDVIEDPNDPREPMVVILSYSEEQGTISDDYRSPRVSTGPLAQNEESRTQGKVTPLDKDKQRFIFWSSKYHFTTDAQGTILATGVVSPQDGKNPYGMLPFVSFCKEQTEGFWSDGGDGLANNGILINVLLADLNFSAKFQATGLGWMTGPESALPTSVAIGPTKFLRLVTKEGDPEVAVGFASPNPALDDQLNIIKEQLGLMLTSEDLEPGSLTGDLTPAGAQSGIQEIIQKSEPITAIEDEQQLYKDKEPVLVSRVMKVARIYQGQGLLCTELEDAGPVPEALDYNLIFVQPRIMLSEEQRVDLVTKQKALGYYTPKMQLQTLHPDLDDQAIEDLVAELGLVDFEVDAEGKQVMGDNGKPKAKPKAAGAPPPGPGPVVAAKAETTIAEVSLNGAQVTGVLDIIERVVNEQMPQASGLALVDAAFPSLTEAQIKAIMDPLLKFKAKEKPAPPAGPGPNPPPVPAPPKGPPKPPPPEPVEA